MAREFREFWNENALKIAEEDSLKKKFTSKGELQTIIYQRWNYWTRFEKLMHHEPELPKRLHLRRAAGIPRQSWEAAGFRKSAQPHAGLPRLGVGPREYLLKFWDEHWPPHNNDQAGLEVLRM